MGQAIVKLQDRWRRPFLVEFPLIPVRKGVVTDGLLSRFVGGDMTLSGLKRVVGGESGGLGRFRVGDNVLYAEELRLVTDVLGHKDDGVDARYKRLGLSGDKGNRLKRTLMEKGVLEAQEVKVGRTRKVLLRTSDAARRMLGLEKRNLQYGSIAHEYWKRYYADIYRENGYRVELEAPRQGGRVDVLARKGAERVAIEVETGKSDIVGNVRRCLGSKFSKVLVVATDEAAIAKVERALAEVGLLIPGRTHLVLRDRYDTAA